MSTFGITPYQSQFAAWQLSRSVAADSSDLLGSTLMDPQVAAFNQRDLGHFHTEAVKLDAGAVDLKSRLVAEVKELDHEIKEVHRTVAVAAILEEKLHWQKKQRELEDKRSQFRRRIFGRQDEIDEQRRQSIDELEGSLQQQTSLQLVFTTHWELH